MGRQGQMIKRTFTAITLCALLAGGFGVPSETITAFGAQGQLPQDAKQTQVRQIINTAKMHYDKGEQAYKSGSYDVARREFDEAVDTILTESIDVRSDDELRGYYRDLIERINRYQIAALEQKDGGFNEQRYEPSPLDKIASLSDADLEEAGAVDDGEVVARFNFDFTYSHPVNQF
ncbi:MAG TPA: hypothetical protein VNI02_07840, partial [Blastocatellia bacterium]|nr:hypothetical protein [Blastocatellia bacterium]